MDYHIRTQDHRNRTVQVVFHVAVPVGNNAAGVPWQQCVREAMSPVGSIEGNTAENVLIANGEVLELVETVHFTSTALTNAQRLAQVLAAYQDRTSTILADLATKLNYWGFAANV